MLHNRRQRLEALAAREAAGESFWTERFDESFRTKTHLLCQKLLATSHFGDLVLEHARELIRFDEGLFALVSASYSAEYDMLQYILHADDSMVPTVIEALSVAFHDPQLMASTRLWGADEAFDEAINVFLTEGRISFELIDQRMVAFESRALHVEVVAPVLSLLARTDGWQSVERAFGEALNELSKGNASNAITDAGTALQEALTGLGCSGNALGPLIKSAKSRGLLAGHDAPMIDGLERIMQWVSADRSEKGDAHSASDASVDDAWLTVHVVGAVILRLSKGTARA